jgi:hypothetical protein
LTSLLLQNHNEIFDEAIRLAGQEGAHKVVKGLQVIHLELEAMQQGAGSTDGTSWKLNDEEDWTYVISPGATAILHDGKAHINEEVKVVSYLYTPQGLKYQLQSTKHGVTWTVNANMLKPIMGETKLLKYNLMTGETKDITEEKAA